ncbi:MAG: D-glycero-beta-D-manno-heptose 1-phosphate adenylyltransferase [Leptospira sp.]|nr:D-glycero-beta-D-manno-heptose 1-phosphate adenylyltransferase [Leptospira sp.]
MSFLEQMNSKIVPKENIAGLKKKLEGKTVVFTNGCFDILHPGHVTYLAKARDLGDYLWVGVNTDASIRRLKGETRPVNSCSDRIAVLSALASVDFLTPFEEDTPIELLLEIRPQIHTKGGDYVIEKLPEYAFLMEIGAKIKILPFVEGKSTTNILEKAKSLS